MPFLSLLLALPVELVLCILGELDARDLLTCKRCSLRLKAVIEASAALQYKLELALAGKIDGPPSTVPLSGRLAAIHAYRAAWATAQHPVVRDGVDDAIATYFHAPGGSMIASLVSGSDTLRVHRQKGVFCGVAEGERLIEGWPRDDQCSFVVDESQKLVVRERRDVEQMAPHWQQLDCAFLSLEDGFPPHPLAARHSLQAYALALHRGPSRDLQDLQIIGDVFGWNAPSNTNRRKHDRIVYNWKTGVKLWHAHLARHVYIHLLSEQRFIIVDRRALMIYVHSIDPHSVEDSPLLQLASQCLCILQLPRLSDVSPHPVHVKSMLQHPPNLAGARPLFQHDPARTALVLDFRFGPGPRRDDDDDDFPSPPDPDRDLHLPALANLDEERHLLFVPVATILDACESAATATPMAQGPPTLRWEAWGPRGTRMLRVPAGIGRLSSVVGAQVAFFRPDDGSRAGDVADVTVYEAFPLAEEADVDEPSPDGATMEEDLIENSWYWTDLGWTTYPVRRTRAVVWVGADERAKWRWRKVLLSHDGLVLLNLGLTSAPQ